MAKIRLERSTRRRRAMAGCIGAAVLIAVWPRHDDPDSIGARPDPAPRRAILAATEPASVPSVAGPNPKAANTLDASSERSGPGSLPAWIVDRIDTRSAESHALHTNREPGGGADGLNGRHLDVLQAMIDINDLDEASSSGDYDDGDGIFEPTELGFQVWSGGQLIALSLGPDPYWTFHYRIDALPENLGDLDQLQFLDLHDNELAELPYSVGSLRALRELRLHDNELTWLPGTLDELTNLIGVNLSDNALDHLPEWIGEFESLEWLHVNDNPLIALPASLGDLPTLRSLAIESRNADASRPGALDAGLQRESTNGLALLPATLESLSNLDTLYVSGNRFACASGRPEPLLVSGSVRVFGLSAQRCP